MTSSLAASYPPAAAAIHRWGQGKDVRGEGERRNSSSLMEVLFVTPLKYSSGVARRTITYILFSTTYFFSCVYPAIKGEEGGGGSHRIYLPVVLLKILILFKKSKISDFFDKNRIIIKKIR